MHKGVILLVQASDSEDAAVKSSKFLEEYGDDKVWDWYAIGGRWSGTLNPKHSEFAKIAKEIVPEQDGFVSLQSVDSKQPELQKAWEELGQEGPNPWANHYKVPKSGGLYDIMPLVDCVATVKDWRQDPEQAGKKAEAEAETRWGKSSEKPNLNMYGYCLKTAAHLYQQDFSFYCNVFNTHWYNFDIPSDPAGWWAIIVDMHT